ncbi:MAG: sodium-dependent transporter [Eggerthellaceae bacterium]|nr:sodium-dependent transporter [Eggerthellaceae bacterium]
MASDQNLTKAKPARAVWSGKMGFVLAAAASAVGLGNLWRFPYLAAKYGGGVFLITYIILVCTFGFALMTAETALGRKTKQSAIGAFSHFGKKYIIIGILASLVPFIITPYYCVIGGWVTKYMVSYVTVGAAELGTDAWASFAGFITGTGAETFLWMIVFIAVVIVVTALGVKNGIERANKILMPLLIVMAVGISIYSLTLPGAIDGLKYYLIPDVSKISIDMVVAAMGQMFFSLSLAMGIMITYGSYFKEEEDLEKSVRRIEIFDTGIALLAGFMIIPASVAILGSADAVAAKAGPKLMFGTLPEVFAGTGSIASVLGFVFFALVFFAALTSAISLFETCVSIVQDGAKWSRTRSIIACSLFIIVLGIVCNLGYNAWIGIDPMYSIFGIGEYQDNQILDFMDFISNTILMPVVALLTCIFIGWIIKPKAIADEVKKSSAFKGEKLFNVMIKYVAPIFVILILVFYVLNTIGIVSL